MIWIVTTVLLLGTTLFFGLAWNASRVRERKYQDVILQSQQDIIDVLTEMRMIDEKKWFETDDEVGIVFKELLLAANKLGEIISPEDTA